MIRWIGKHRQTVLMVTLVAVVVGCFVGFGAYFVRDSERDAAIIVNGENISYERYRSRRQQYLRQFQEKGVSLDEQKYLSVRQQAVQDLIRETLFAKEADKYGIVVTDNELASYIQSAQAFQRNGQFDQMTYFRVLQEILHVSPEEFEEDRRREIKIQKMQILMASSVKVSDAELNWSFQKKLEGLSPQERKKFLQKPEEVRDQLRQEQVSYVFQEWLTQLNNQLKTQILLDKFERKEG